MPTSFEFGFHYSGPREPTPSLECVTCRAAASKRCPAHSSPTESCAHCAAAQGAPCQAHWGLAAALQEYASRGDLKDLGPEAESDFAYAAQIVTQTTSPKSRNHVTVNIRADRDGGVMGGRSLVIELVPRS